MRLDQIAADLSRSDPDRFRASLVAPADLRPRLWTLYALNRELARAPLQSNEPMIAQMRLQWWADQLARIGQGQGAGAHELLEPLAQVWGRDAGSLVDLVEARHRDCGREPFHNADEVTDYVGQTAGALMAHAARALGLDMVPQALRDHALGTGLAQWLAVLPQLDEWGMGLARRDPEVIAGLATTGAAALIRAHAARRDVPRAVAPALFRGPGQLAALRRMAADGQPSAPLVSEFQRRLALGRLALTGRWWAGNR